MKFSTVTPDPVVNIELTMREAAMLHSILRMLDTDKNDFQDFLYELWGYLDNGLTSEQVVNIGDADIYL